MIPVTYNFLGMISNTNVIHNIINSFISLARPVFYTFVKSIFLTGIRSTRSFNPGPVRSEILDILRLIIASRTNPGSLWTQNTPGRIGLQKDN